MAMLFQAVEMCLEEEQYIAFVCRVVLAQMQVREACSVIYNLCGMEMKILRK